MAGKPQPFKRTRRSTRRSGWKRGEASWKRLFLNEMKRSNNILSAIRYAHITWECYTGWLATNFLTQQELSAAEATFHQRHPAVDIIVKHSDDELYDAGLGVSVEPPIEAVGYDELNILRADGWISTDDWTDDL